MSQEPEVPAEVDPKHNIAAFPDALSDAMKELRQHQKGIDAEIAKNVQPKRDAMNVRKKEILETIGMPAKYFNGLWRVYMDQMDLQVMEGDNKDLEEKVKRGVQRLQLDLFHD